MTTPGLALAPDPYFAPPERLRDLIVTFGCDYNKQAEAVHADEAVVEAWLSKPHTLPGDLLGSALLTVAYRSPELLDDRLRELDGALHTLSQHQETSGHDLCCSWECPCSHWSRQQPDGTRCDSCEAVPVTAVDYAAGEVLRLVGREVSETAVAALIKATS